MGSVTLLSHWQYSACQVTSESIQWIIYLNILSLFHFLQRCSPPSLVLSLSPGLGPDGLPSPAGSCRRGSPVSSAHAAAAAMRMTASPLTGATRRDSPIMFSNEMMLHQLASSMRSSTGTTPPDMLQVAHFISIWYCVNIDRVCSKSYSWPQIYPNKRLNSLS